MVDNLKKNSWYEKFKTRERNERNSEKTHTEEGLIRAPDAKFRTLGINGIDFAREDRQSKQLMGDLSVFEHYLL